MTPAHVSEAFAGQAIACRGLDSPFMGQLCDLLSVQEWPAGAVRDRIFAWEGDLSPKSESVPLRLAGGLHALRLKGDTALADVYPPESASDDALWDTIADVLVREEGFLINWLKSAPQTNEVRRSTVLIAVGHLLAARFGLPMRTSELGASGGLNLCWDRYGLNAGGQIFGPTDVMTLTPDWTGPLPPTTRPTVTSRAGVDLNPLNPRNAGDAMRLQAYLWPDQPERMERTKAAIAAATDPVAQADAINWLAPRLGHGQGELHLIYTTVAWQYFPAEKQKEGRALIEAAGATATVETPLAWFGMENDGSGKGAALTLQLWPGNVRLDLGRADFHGRWVNWTGGA